MAKKKTQKKEEKMARRKVIRNEGGHKKEDLEKRAAAVGCDVSRIIEMGLFDEAHKMIEAVEGQKAAEAKIAATKKSALPLNRWQRLWNKMDRAIHKLGVEDCEMSMAMLHLTLKEGEGGGTTDWGHKAGIKAMCLSYKYDMLKEPWRGLVEKMIKESPELTELANAE